MRFSDYIVFVDESGDHGMANIDPAFPLFVLSCCLISKRDYMAAVVPAIQRIKFATFGHDAVVLHEREIRRDLGAFSVLRDREKKQAFIDALTDALASAPMTIFLLSSTSAAFRIASAGRILTKSRCVSALSGCTTNSANRARSRNAGQH